MNGVQTCALPISDVSQETLRKAFIKTKDVVGTALVGEISTATKALDALGLSADKFTGDTDAFLSIASALGTVENSAIQAKLANDLFGERLGSQILTLAKAGGEALKEYAEELSDIGVLSNETVAKLAGFDNVINRIKTSVSTAGNEIGASMLPVMETFARLMEEKIVPLLRNIADWFTNLSDRTKVIIVSVLAFTAALAPLLLIGGKVSTMLGGILSIIPKINTALAFLAANPIIAIIAAVAVLLGVLYTTNERFRGSINKLIGTLSKALAPILEIVGGLLSDIFELLTPILELLGNVLAKRIEQFLTIIKPVLAVLEFILNIIQKIIDGVMFVFGKGWLWGKEKDQGNPDTSVAGASIGSLSIPDFTAPSMTTNSTANATTYQTSAAINIYPTENQSAEDIANEVSKIIYSKVTARGGA